MLNWVKRFNIFCFLDNCNYDFQPQQYECLVGAGARDFLQSGSHALDALGEARQQNKWWFGHLSYELQHASFGILEKKPDPIGFLLFYFFRPHVVMYLRGEQLVIEADNPAAIYKELMEVATEGMGFKAVSLQQRFTRKQYIETVDRLKQHMQRGDCYELNFCQEC